MNGEDLKAIRCFLFLSVVELSEYIGKSKRIWQYWESGERQIPEKIVELMNELVAERQKMLLLDPKQLAKIQPKNLIQTRLIESVKAELLVKKLGLHQS